MVTNKNNYKVSKNKHTTDEDKNKQIHTHIKIHKEHLKNITKIKKYRKLSMTEHKTDMNITKIVKYKILTFCYLNLHFCDFFTLACDFFHLNFHFYVFFTPCFYFL